VNQFTGNMYKEHGYVFRPCEIQVLSSIRISPDVYTTEEEMDRFLEALKQIDGRGDGPKPRVRPARGRFSPPYLNAFTGVMRLARWAAT
jgi:hypothetical protein